MKSIALFLILAIVTSAHAGSLLKWPADGRLETGNVVVVHPDGTSLAHWCAGRILLAGPDGMLNWDRVPHLAVYRSHMRDTLGVSSHGGGTTHAYGVKVPVDSYGMDHDQPLLSLSGKPYSVMTEALRAGKAVGIVNSGSVIEPGTGAFLAQVPMRTADAEITRQIILSGAQVILAGGEEWLLPAGVSGRHVKSGRRSDGTNLIEVAVSRGYAVVYDRKELLALPKTTTRVLGVFAAAHTFHDELEDSLAAADKPLYEPAAPSVADMTTVALQVLGLSTNGFFLFVEEEGTDNFSNHTHARGMLEALRRGDEAVGVVRDYRKLHPDTLLITAADSDAGGPEVLAPYPESSPVPTTTDSGAQLDGANGTGTPPFISAPDQFGKTHTFAVAWGAGNDTSGGMITRAEGPNAELYDSGCADNTDIYRMIYATLFGQRL